MVLFSKVEYYKVFHSKVFQMVLSFVSHFVLHFVSHFVACGHPVSATSEPTLIELPNGIGVHEIIDRFWRRVQPVRCEGRSRGECVFFGASAGVGPNHANWLSSSAR